RVIQDGVVRRVGSETNDAVVNVRFIAATNSDPEEAVKAGTLREDLYYRLRVVPIQVPPLRDRPEDIPLLAEYFLSTYWIRHRNKGAPFPKLSDAAIRALCGHNWRGNVRELQNAIEHVAVIVEPGTEIRPEDLQLTGEGESRATANPASLISTLLEESYHAARDRVIAQFERQYLTWLVNRAGGNMSKAARIAGVDRTTCAPRSPRSCSWRNRCRTRKTVPSPIASAASWGSFIVRRLVCAPRRVTCSSTPAGATGCSSAGPSPSPSSRSSTRCEAWCCRSPKRSGSRSSWSIRCRSGASATPARWDGCCSTSRPMPSSSPRRASSRSPPGRSARRASSSRSVTRARASTPPCCRLCTSRSARGRQGRATTSPARGSGLPSAASSSTQWGRSCGLRRGHTGARGSRSSSSCPPRQFDHAAGRRGDPTRAERARHDGATVRPTTPFQPLDPQGLNQRGLAHGPRTRLAQRSGHGDVAGYRNRSRPAEHRAAPRGVASRTRPGALVTAPAEHRRSRGRAHCSVAAAAADRGADQAHLARPGAVQANARRPGPAGPG